LPIFAQELSKEGKTPRALRERLGSERGSMTRSSFA
jgi:hypothetical protein